MMRNILLKIEYDGTGFSGWQKQPDKLTVQGELERVLSVLCAKKITIDGTGRTDAGVHAYGQCATFSGDFSIPTDRLMIAANDLLSPGGTAAGAIRITEATEVPERFHARFDAKGKEYIYKIYNGTDIPVFKRNYYYRVKYPLDLKKMRQAAERIEGVHDFTAFMAQGGNPGPSPVRNVMSIEVAETTGRETEIRVIGDGFLYNMVRIIAGTLVDVGLNKMSPEYVSEIIEFKDRTKAGHTAPPSGLYLAKVYFDEDEMTKDVLSAGERKALYDTEK